MAQPFSSTFASPAERPRSASNDAPVDALDDRLWLAVCLPELALQSADPHRCAQPSVVVDSLQGRLCVVAVNGSARELGIAPGMSLSAAFAFSGSIRVLERSPRLERIHLEALAAACHRLTPVVSLEPEESLLLEVRASLKLFGGLANIRKALTEEIGSRGFTFHSCAAPTPLGALWLARHARGDAWSKKALLSCIGSLPLHATRWPEQVQAALKDMGLATIGDCLRLPRHGLARRIGKQYLDDLDKAAGRRPDLRRNFESPQTLTFRVELFDGTTSLPVFVDAATRMTEHLANELRLRQAQVQKMQLVFHHLRQVDTAHCVELLEPSGDRRRLLDLLCDKLERIALPTPAIALSLCAGPLQPMCRLEGELFKSAPGSSDEASAARLVERLRGRLGREAVHGLVLTADHRPERAWGGTVTRLRGNESAPPSPWAGSRPLWLLPEPRELRCVGSKPCYDGVLHPTDGPERIESGWWDGHGISRDYFAVVTEHGQRLWVFRDRVERCWYLHGIFG